MKKNHLKPTYNSFSKHMIFVNDDGLMRDWSTDEVKFIGKRDLFDIDTQHFVQDTSQFT